MSRSTTRTGQEGDERVNSCNSLTCLNAAEIQFAFPHQKKPTFCEPLWREKQNHTHTDKLETGSGQPRRGGGNPWRWGGHCPPQRLPKLPVPAEVPKRNGIRGKCTSRLAA